MLNHGPKRNDVEHFEKAGSGFKIQEEPKPRVVFLQYYTCITMQDLADTFCLLVPAVLHSFVDTTSFLQGVQDSKTELDREISCLSFAY